jgi:hypothetical protein
MAAIRFMRLPAEFWPYARDDPRMPIDTRPVLVAPPLGIPTADQSSSDTLLEQRVWAEALAISVLHDFLRMQAEARSSRIPRGISPAIRPTRAPRDASHRRARSRRAHRRSARSTPRELRDVCEVRLRGEVRTTKAHPSLVCPLACCLARPQHHIPNWYPNLNPYSRGSSGAPPANSRRTPSLR